MKNSCLSFGLLILLTAPSQAGVFTLTGVDGGKGANIQYYHNGTTASGFAGVILGTYNGVSVSPLFCVDLFTDINYGNYDSNPLTPNLVRHEDRAAWLYINRLSTVVSADTGLALQVAIWDIVHDGGDGLAAGAGLVNSSATSLIGLTQVQINLATAYILESQGHSVMTGVSIYQNFVQGTQTGVQNLIGVQAAVPEPSTLLMAAAGVAGIGFARLRAKNV